jgi:ribose transport system substrate-binding protein
MQHLRFNAGWRLAATLVIGAVVGACSGSSASSAPPTQASATTAATTAPSAATTAPSAAAASPYGALIKEYLTADANPSWVKWDAASCAFVTATAPYTGAYKVDLYGPGTKKLSVVWTPEETVADNVILATQSFQAAADKAGFKITVISNNYPDTAQPIKAANDAVTLKPDVVLSMNILSDLQKAVFDIYKQACTPAVAFAVLPPDGIPFVAASWMDAGRLDGENALKAMAAKGWTMADTSVFFCINGSLGTASGGPFDGIKAYDAAISTSPGYDKTRVSYQDCSGGTGAATDDTNLAATRDWLTAHPNAKHILMFAGPDAAGFQVYNAVIAAGRGDQAIVEGVGLTKPVRALLLKNDPTYVGSVDFGLPLYGPYGIAIAQDIAAGNPVPLRVVQQLRLVDATTIKSVLAERGTTE